VVHEVLVYKLFQPVLPASQLDEAENTQCLLVLLCRLLMQTYPQQQTHTNIPLT
jgi:hypothetical protein